MPSKWFQFSQYRASFIRNSNKNLVTYQQEDIRILLNRIVRIDLSFQYFCYHSKIYISNKINFLYNLLFFYLGKWIIIFCFPQYSSNVKCELKLGTIILNTSNDWPMKPSNDCKTEDLFVRYTIYWTMDFIWSDSIVVVFVCAIFYLLMEIFAIDIEKRQRIIKIHIRNIELVLV